MPIVYPQSVIDDYEMSKSVMDAPRPWYQRMGDMAFGRNPAERFTSAMTALTPGMIFRGTVTPARALSMRSQAINHGWSDPDRIVPFSWLYGDAGDIGKYTKTPTSYTALYDPVKRTAGIGVPLNPNKDFIFHEDLLREILSEQLQQDMKLNLKGKPLPPDLYGSPQEALIPRGLDDFSHIRGYQGDLMKKGSLYDKPYVTVNAPYPHEWLSLPQNIWAKKEGDALNEALGFLERRNLLYPDVPVDISRIQSHGASKSIDYFGH